MPDVRLVDAVQDQVGQRDRVDEVLLLAAVEGVLAQGPRAASAVASGAQARAHVLEGLGEEAAGAAAGVVDRLADLRVDDPDHRPDDLARREELAAVVALLAHLEQQALVDLREREDVGRVDGLEVDLVHLVQHVEEVALGVDARSCRPRT